MTENLNKKFFAFVIPSVLAFALSGVYSIVDGFFIGRTLGDVGLASSALAYPACAFVQAVGTGIGLSGAIHFAIVKAQGKHEEQQTCFSSTAWLMLLASIMLTALFHFGAIPIMRLLGARGETLTLSVEYVRVIAIGTIFQLMATGFVPFVRNLGGATFSMFSMMLGFFTNIVLDYLFVWVFHWGMAGAAWATVIGQGMTLLAAVIFLAVKKQNITFPSLSKIAGLWGNILKLSISPLGLTFSQTFTLLLMNRFLLIHGDEQAVAVFGCIDYILTIVYLLLQGVGDGCQPLISNYYGKGNDNAVKAIRKTAYLTAAALAGACMIAVFAARAQIGVLFGASPETNLDVAKYLPWFLATMLCLSVVRVTTSYFYATEKAALSYLLVYAEPVCTLLLLVILPLMLGLTGVWLAVPVAQVVTFVIALIAKKNTDGALTSNRA